MPSFCDQCGNELKNEDAKFCDKCGAEVKNQNNDNTSGNVTETICPHCAKPTPVGETICPHCGLDVQMENNLVAVIIGYIGLWLLPIVSLIVGIYLLTRKNNKSRTQGVFLIIFTILFYIAGFIVDYYYNVNGFGGVMLMYGHDWYLIEAVSRYVVVPLIGTIIGVITWSKNFTLFK